MSFSYDRYDSRSAPATRRSVFGWWMPVMVTTTLVAGGLVAWVLKSREDGLHNVGEHEDDDALSYGEHTDNEGKGKASTRPPVGPGGRPPTYGGDQGAQTQEGQQTQEDTSLLGRVSGAIRRTPSPQQLYDGAKVKVAAGVAAAGAVVGGALGSIREDHKEDDFADHERWKETTGSNVGAAGPSRTPGARNRRTVAIVLSAEDGDVPLEEEEEKGYRSEQASLLSQIPPVDQNSINLLVLIYAPRSQQPPLASSAGPKPPSSLGSSYALPTPGEDLAHLEPAPLTPALSAKSASSSYYDLLYRQASRLVSNPVSIMPFTTPTGHVNMLKHLGPNIVYLTDSLSGPKGENVAALRDWVGGIVVIVGGDNTGLVDDTEDDSQISPDDEAHPRKGVGKGTWWVGSDMIGLGKRVEIVDAIRLEDDWERRIGGRE